MIFAHEALMIISHCDSFFPIQNHEEQSPIINNMLIGAKSFSPETQLPMLAAQIGGGWEGWQRQA